MNWQSPELVAASLVGLPTPRRLEEMPEIQLTPEQIAEGGQCEERR